RAPVARRLRTRLLVASAAVRLRLGLGARRGLLALRRFGLAARRGLGLAARRGLGLAAPRGLGLAPRRGPRLAARRRLGPAARRLRLAVRRRGHPLLGVLLGLVRHGPFHTTPGVWMDAAPSVRSRMVTEPAGGTVCARLRRAPAGSNESAAQRSRRSLLEVIRRPRLVRHRGGALMSSKLYTGLALILTSAVGMGCVVKTGPATRTRDHRTAQNTQPAEPPPPVEEEPPPPAEPAPVAEPSP